MAEARVVFAEPLLQGGLPSDACRSKKAFATSSLLIGLGFLFLLSLMPRSSTEAQHLKIENPTVAMAMQGPQLQPIRSSLSMGPTKAVPFTQPSKIWLHMHPSAGKHSKGLAVQAARIRGSPTVRFGDQYYDDSQSWSEGGEGGGTTGTGKIARWNSDRGFGFIQPDDGGEDLFCHVTSLADGDGSVARGDFVTFYKEWNDRNGKYEATDVRFDATKEKPVLEEEEGVIIRWNDERGFGFIHPAKGGDDVFCHASNLVQGEAPGPRDKVSFVNEYNEMRGKSEATNVRILEQGTGELPREGPGESAVEGKGQMLRWNSERGFGFIRQDDGSEEDLFAHVSALVGGEGSVKDGDLVSYKKDFNERKQKDQAYEVKYVGEGPPLNEYGEPMGEEGEEQTEEA